MRADLHVHSTASDGSLSPRELVELALSAGLDVLAIADHDSVEGLPAADEAARNTSLILVPAVELSAVHGAHDIHLLGYYVDPRDDALAASLADLRAARLRRAQTMVASLAAGGYDVSIEDVLALSEGGAVGRSHVARALVGAGYAPTVADAFRTFIGHGRPFYVAKDVRTAEQAIGLIHDAGGLAVVAHPGVNRLDPVLDELVSWGLDGIEAYHADHDTEQRDRYERYAERHSLLVTGGTDFHGPDAPNPALGDADVPVSAVRALLAADPRGAQRG